MGTQVLTGSKAIYLGPGSTDAWKLREGVECVVTQDTCCECDFIPVRFDGEDIEVKVATEKLEFIDRKTRDYG